MLDCLQAAEDVIKNCMDVPESAADLTHFEEMLEDVRGRLRRP
jgi:hypothetical protein